MRVVPLGKKQAVIDDALAKMLGKRTRAPEASVNAPLFLFNLSVRPQLPGQRSGHRLTRSRGERVTRAPERRGSCARKAGARAGSCPEWRLDGASPASRSPRTRGLARPTLRGRAGLGSTLAARAEQAPGAPTPHAPQMRGEPQVTGPEPPPRPGRPPCSGARSRPHAGPSRFRPARRDALTMALPSTAAPSVSAASSSRRGSGPRPDPRRLLGAQLGTGSRGSCDFPLREIGEAAACSATCWGLCAVPRARGPAPCSPALRSFVVFIHSFHHGLLTVSSVQKDFRTGGSA